MHNTNQSQATNNTNEKARDAVNPDLCEGEKAIKALVINPFEMVVSEAFFGGGLDEIYWLIGARPVTVAPIGEAGDGIYIDDEGLFKSNQCFFKIEGYPQALAGKGLVLGLDDQGESVAPVLTLKAVQAAIRWVQPITQKLWIDRVSGALYTTEQLCAE